MNKKKNAQSQTNPKSPAEGERGASSAKKRVRFGRLYIAAAICTACVCLTVLAVTNRISNSVVRWDENSAVAVPTAPQDVILDGLLHAPSAPPLSADKTPEPADIPETPAAPEPPATPEKPEYAPTDESEVAEAGLFGKQDEFTLQMPLEGAVCTDFSMDRLKKSKTMGDWRTHSGVDLAADVGTAVAAAADGTVERAFSDDYMGYVVILRHGEEYKTVYANLASASMVREGQEIKAGECLGAVGDSAVSEKLEPAHLHFELLCGETPRDPSDFIG